MALDGTPDATRRSGKPDEAFHHRAEDIQVTDTTGSPHGDENLAKIRRSNAETEKFIEEAYKLRAEEAKLRAEERKLGRDAWASPVATVASAMTAGAALFGAGLALAPLFGR